MTMRSLVPKIRGWMATTLMVSKARKKKNEDQKGLL